MSASLPPATALMNHADDPRHIIYSTWVIPHFFPYMRDLLNELTKQPAHAKFARGLLDAVFSPAEQHSVFKAYGEGGVSIRDNQAWGAVTVAMIYFIFTTDFYFAAPMTAPMKADHLGQLRVLNFPGPKFPAQLLK
ncbi:hypothetical protein EDB85DRAFT_2285835 [Lactarius pseudohatsudake]|nr:hypothetical protein EDB85DRAFT_2285835 [Lactarius pseudohatsudake]